MDPRIQYARTSDGVNIAYWTMGEGVPLVVMPQIPFSHVELEWQLPDNPGEFYRRLASKAQVVRYDNRGSGLSDRNVADFSLPAHVLDLQAVVERVELEEVVLFAPVTAAPVAILYATNHPETVTGLILWCASARADDLLQTPMVRGLDALMGNDWELFTETIAQLLYGFSGGEPARRFAAATRHSVSSEVAAATFDAMREYDVADLLPGIGCPTLVLHRRDMKVPSTESSKTIATRIPNARLALVDGSSMLPYVEHVDPVLSIIYDFLHLETTESESAMPPEAPGGFATVLFTDIEGSTALTERLGDLAARELFREHERITREALKAHGGSEVKSLGDGFMASFSSATKALECATAIQRAIFRQNQLAQEPVHVRIGLNAGEPIAEDRDLFGIAVNAAARIAAEANGGEILVSDVVRQLVAGKRFTFRGRGETVLRGFEDPVRIFEVRWQQ